MMHYFKISGKYHDIIVSHLYLNYKAGKVRNNLTGQPGKEMP